MKYCEKCGRELLDEAVICPGCGCATGYRVFGQAQEDGASLVAELANRVKINGIIWLCIAGVQILSGTVHNWMLLIIGALNIYSGIRDLQYSNSVQEKPTGIVRKFEPLTAPIITLIYNLLFGGVIGAVGSVYYLACIRGFVLKNRQAFEDVGTQFSAIS
ncbi:MAG: zinc ribbon domain-containing protein [Oscillospiraceae bacterium]|nr:zinc ribbon domain-containing protein [Oscillospiraceae bacterium]